MSPRRVAPTLLRLGRRVRALLFPPPVEVEVDEELEHHVRMRARDLVAEGWDEDAARREALRRFGDLERVRTTCRKLGSEREARMRWDALWSETVRDVAHGIRQVGRRPGFAAVAVLTLALGIGANTAVFSVVRGVLLRPLPYAEPDRLVSLWTRYLPSTGIDIDQFVLSGPEVLDYRDASRAMEDVVPWVSTNRTLTGDEGDPERIPTVLAGEGLFELLGVRAALGRTFTPEEQAPDAPRAVLLSHGLWNDRFGADPAVVGRALTVDGEIARIVGVMPPDFVFPTAGTRMWETLRFDEARPGGRGSHGLAAVGRLAEGATLAAAEAELETITAAWYQEHEHHAAGHFIWFEPLRDDLVGDAGGVVLLLMGAVGLVLLVACGNVANLFLARAEARQREMAVRTALGAGRGRLTRQLLTEGLVVSGLGACLGLLLAGWGTPALLALDPTALPRSEGVRLDRTVLAFTAGITVAATLLFALVPALQGAGALARGLAGGRGSSDDTGRRSLRRGLVAGQAALSLVVVLAAGLAIRSFDALRSEDPGVRTANVVTFDLSLPSSSYPQGEDVARAYGALQERLEALPAVASAAAVSILPLRGLPGRGDFQPEGEAAPAGAVPAWNAHYAAVQPGYFETLGIPVLQGRALTEGDDAESPLVVGVSRALVERYWPGQDVLGRRITFAMGGDDPPWLTIVGVVGDVRALMDAPPDPQVYLAHDQLRAIPFGGGRAMTVVARTGVEPGTLIPALRAAVAEMDPRLPLANVQTMEDVRSRAVARPRLAASLLGAFGLVALLLAAVGIYGVVSYTVARRTREIGVRVALGAGRGQVVRLMVREGTMPAAVGAAVGLVVALAGAGALREFLHGVSPTDPVSFIGLPLALLAVAVASAWLPARRATRVAPTEALRDE
ncbi:MAG: ABC transporter permease [Gemmatimonadetes bacterium]|nr:ABC transporter permease [Gemmatimonadota bacterium]